MCPEYGATVGFFPVDEVSLEYLRQTGRTTENVRQIHEYLKVSSMFRNYNDASTDPQYSKIYELDLSTVVSSLSGPKRPHDRVSVTDMKNDFLECLTNPVGFKGFNIPSDQLSKTVPFLYEGRSIL